MSVTAIGAVVALTSAVVHATRDFASASAIFASAITETIWAFVVEAIAHGEAVRAALWNQSSLVITPKKARSRRVVVAPVSHVLCARLGPPSERVIVVIYCIALLFRAHLITVALPPSTLV